MWLLGLAGWVATWVVISCWVKWVKEQKNKQIDSLACANLKLESRLRDAIQYAKALSKANDQIGEANHGLVERNRELIEQTDRLNMINDALRFKIRGEEAVLWTPAVKVEFISGHFSKN